MSRQLKDPGQWVYDYVTSEESVMQRIEAKIDKLAQNRSPAILDEAIQQGDFDALLCRYPVEVCRLIQINQASNELGMNVIGSGYHYDYHDFKSYFNSGVFHERWSQRFCDWITQIELQQAEGWSGYQKTFHFTGGFALLEEIEHVLRDNLAIWRVWDCRALIESLVARKGALFHFYNTVRKRNDYSHKKFEYDPDHTIQSVRKFRAIYSQDGKKAMQDSKPSNLRRRAVQNRKEQQFSPIGAYDLLTEEQSLKRKGRHGNNVTVSSVSSFLHRCVHFKSQIRVPKGISKSIRGRDIDTIVFSIVICVSGAFLVLSFWKPSEAGFWNNLSQTCFYLLTTYFSLWSASGKKGSKSSPSESEVVCQILFYCGVVCVLLSAVVYHFSNNTSSVLAFASNFCQVVAIRLLLESGESRAGEV